MNESEGASTSKKSSYQHSTGYRLGSGNEPSEVIPGAPKPKETVNTLEL